MESTGFLSLVLTLSSYAKKVMGAYHTVKPWEMNFIPSQNLKIGQCSFLVSCLMTFSTLEEFEHN